MIKPVFSRVRERGVGDGGRDDRKRTSARGRRTVVGMETLESRAVPSGAGHGAAYAVLQAPQAVAAASLTDTTPPSVPIGLVGTAVTQTSVSLAWDPSADDTGVAGYNVYESRHWGWHNTQTEWVLVTTVADPTVTLTGLAVGSGHTYAVAAFDAAGNASDRSDPLAVTTLSPPHIYANAYNDTEILPGQALKFSVSASGTPAPALSVAAGPRGMAVDDTTGAVLWTPTAADAGTVTFTIRASNSEGYADLTATITVLPAGTDRTPPSAVSDLTSSAAVPHGFTLAWSPATDNVGVDHYQIQVFGQVGYRKQVNLTLLTAGPVTSFVVNDPRIVAGKTYRVTVTAFDLAGNAGLAMTINVSTPLT